MKRITLLCLFVGLLALSSCSKEESILGTWRVASVTVVVGGSTISDSDDTSKMYYEFRNDGTIVQYATTSEMGTYVYNPTLGKLVYKFQNDTEESTADIAISGNEMDWNESANGASLIMHLKRQ